MMKKADTKFPNELTQALGTISIQMDAVSDVLQTPEENKLMLDAEQAYDALTVSLSKLHRNLIQRGHQASNKIAVTDFDKEVLVDHFRNLRPEEIVEEI